MSADELWTTAPLNLQIREILTPVLAGFTHDASISKPKNLEVLLSKLSDPAQREQIDAAVGMKKNSFYDKVCAAYQREQELAAPTNFDSFVEVKKEDPMEEDDAFAHFAEPEETPYQREMREADEILASIKAARIASKK